MLYNINAKHVRVKDGTLRPGQYADGSFALQIEDADEDGMPNTETLSVNLSAYLPAPPEGHIYVKDYAENEGLPDALEEAGIGEIVGDPLYIGPFNSLVRLVRLTVDVTA